MNKIVFTIHFYFLLGMICYFIPLNGDLKDHLKKAENKTEIHKIPGIDFIYMINLDQRPEKFEACLEKLTPYGIIPYRFSAVNGWELSLEAINDLGIRITSDMQKNFWGTTYLMDGNFSPSSKTSSCWGNIFLSLYEPRCHWYCFKPSFYPSRCI